MTEIAHEKRRLLYKTDLNTVCLRYPVEKEKAHEFMSFIKRKYPHRCPDLEIAKNEIARFFNPQNSR